MLKLARTTTLLLCLVGGCGEDEEPSAHMQGEPDAQAAADAGSLDASDGAPAAPADAASPLDAALDGVEAMDASSDAGADASALDAALEPSQEAGPQDAGKPDATLPDAMLPDAMLPDAAPLLPTFSNVRAIFDNACSGCHGDDADLTLAGEPVPTLYAELLGASGMGQLAQGEECQSSGKRRVVPFMPNASLLVQKLEGTANCGAAMPIGDALTASEINLVRAWISAGAAND